MAEDRIDSFFSLQEIENEKQRVITILKEVVVGIREVSTTVIDMNKNFGNTKSVKDTQQGLEQLNTTIEKQKQLDEQLLKTQAELLKLDQQRGQRIKELAAGYTGLAKSGELTATNFTEKKEKLKELNKAIIENQNEVKRLQERNKELGKNYDENSDRIAKNQGNIVAIKEETRKFASEQKLLLKEIEAAPGSLEEMAAAYSRLEKEYRSLSTAEREGAVGQQMKQDLVELNTELVKQEGQIGKHQRKVGDYENAIRVTTMSLGEMRKEFRYLNEVGFGNMTQEQITATKQRMGELKDGMTKAKMEINGLSNDTMPALNQSLGMVTQSAQSYAMMMMMFGDLNEEQKASVQRLMRATMMLGTAVSVLTKINQAWRANVIKDNAMKIAGAVKTGALTVATVAATAAQWLWTASVKAFSATIYKIPVFGWLLAIIGAIIFAVGLLVKNWDKLTSLFRKSNKHLEEQVETMGRVAKAVKNLYDTWEEKHKTRIKGMQREIEMAEAEGKTVEEISEMKRKVFLQEMKQQEQRIKLLTIVAKMEGWLGREAQIRLKTQQEELEELQHAYAVFEAKITTSQRNEAKKRADEQAKLLEAQKKANADFVADIMKRNQTEIEKLTEKFTAEKKYLDDNLRDHADYNKMLEVLKTNYENAIAEIENQTRIEAQQKSLQFEKDKLNLLYQQELLSLQQSVQSKEEFEAKKRAMDSQYLQDQITTLELFGASEAEINELRLQQNQTFLDAKFQQEQIANEKQKQEIQAAMQFAEQYSQRAMENVSSLISGNMNEFLKQNAVLLLDMIEKQVIASTVMAKIQSMSMPDAVATFGVAGIIRAAVLAGLIKGAFAVVKSQIMKVPQYATGRDGGASELAIVGERGQELVYGKNFAYLTPNKATMTYLPAGASVVPHNETMQILNNNVDFGNVENRLSRIEKAILGKETPSFHITEKGLFTIYKRGVQKTTYLNNLKS